MCQRWQIVFKIHDLVSKRIVCRSQGLIYIVHIALKISFDLTPIENLTKEVRISMTLKLESLTNYNSQEDKKKFGIKFLLNVGDTPKEVTRTKQRQDNHVF